MPATRLELRRREREILETLSVRVPYMTAEQIGRLWWPDNKDPTTDARRRLAKLKRFGFVSSKSCSDQVLADTSLRPLVSWSADASPRLTEDDAGKIADKAKRRWRHVGLTQLTLYQASDKALNIFSTKRSPPLDDLHQLRHDFLLVQVFVHYFVSDCDRATRWRGEQCYKDLFTSQVRLFREDEASPLEIHVSKQKLPDAMVLAPEGYPERIVESAGSYSKQRIQAFIDHWQNYPRSWDGGTGVDFELW